MTFDLNYHFYRAINTITHKQTWKQSILNKKFQEEVKKIIDNRTF